MTSEYWNNAYAGKLFLSYVEPHLSVTSNTLARRVRTVLEMSGIDITIFGAHSVRGASSSKAMELSASIDSILQAGEYWSSTRTFNKHYCRRNSLYFKRSRKNIKLEFRL